MSAFSYFAVFNSVTQYSVTNFKEAQFVNDSDLLLLLTYKYNFGVFDFQQAKKESRLKHLTQQMMEASRFEGVNTQIA